MRKITEVPVPLYQGGVFVKHLLILAPVLAATFLTAGCSAGGPDSRDSQSPFGVLDFLVWNHEWNKHHYASLEEVEKAAVMMKEAGIGFVRMDFLWQDIEPEKGKFDFKKYDELTGILAKHDLRILALLNYNTDWSSKVWNAAPDRALFVGYVRKVVHRYKKKVKYWELWNEPDDRLYWQPQDYMKAYTLLLKDVTAAIKQEDPTAKVVLGGMAKFIPQSLKHVYQNGGKDSFDIVNCHPFQDPRTAEALNQLRGAYLGMRKVMEAYGDGEKDLWFTELGSPGVAAGKRPYTGWWLGPNPSEDLQARWLTKVYTKALEWPGVKKIFWAFFRDLDGFFDTGVNDFGLVRHDFSKKPSYDAYRKVTQEYAARHPAN